MSAGRRLLFVSPQYLIPADAGGKIRTSGILRGLTGGRFHVTLASPAPPGAAERDRATLAELCDRFVCWPEPAEQPFAFARRAAALLSPLPYSAAMVRSQAARETVERELAARPDVAVFDYAQSTVLAPEEIEAATVCFTHNVEAEILRRHVDYAGDAARRWGWRRQHRKMDRLERRGLRRFGRVIAISERDRKTFEQDYGLAQTASIPTGVDLDYFRFAPPRRADGPASRLVFTGSMDWRANIDGIEFFIDSVWPELAAAAPGAAMTVVGRNPPARLVERAGALGPAWRFTGFVDDVRPHVEAADIYVVPLRIGGGTRIKIYEAMAMGRPVVSTALGVEGLPVRPEEHFLPAETPAEFARAVARLATDAELRRRLARAARGFVEANFGAARVARAFEDICLEACGAAAERPRMAASAHS